MVPVRKCLTLLAHIWQSTSSTCSSKLCMLSFLQHYKFESLCCDVFNFTWMLNCCFYRKRSVKCFRAYLSMEFHAGEFSSSDDSIPEPVVVEVWPLPGTGHGTLTAPQRHIIMEATHCSAATRKRSGRSARTLSICGPVDGQEAARDMAEGFILDRAHRNHYNYEKRINQHKFINRFGKCTLSRHGWNFE